MEQHGGTLSVLVLRGVILTTAVVVGVGVLAGWGILVTIDRLRGDRR